jgi:uncharacterized protein (UPF0332 family)
LALLSGMAIRSFIKESVLYVCLLASSKHAGVRGLFNRQYVKTGKIPKDFARIYNDLFERRQEGEGADTGGCHV